jgi:hypothetical protein
MRRFPPNHPNAIGNNKIDILENKLYHTTYMVHKSHDVLTPKSRRKAREASQSTNFYGKQKPHYALFIIVIPFQFNLMGKIYLISLFYMLSNLQEMVFAKLCLVDQPITQWISDG